METREFDRLVSDGSWWEHLEVDAQGYTVYNSSIFDRGPVAFWQSNTPLPSHAMGVWFKSNASNAPFVIIAEHWFSAKNSACVPETGGSFPYWTWEQYDEIGTTLKSRAWTGPSYAGGLLYASDDGGPARPGDYWLQTDTGPVDVLQRYQLGNGQPW